MTGQLHAPAALAPRKEPSVRIGYEAGWAARLVWILRRKKKSPPCLCRSSSPWPSHYTYWIMFR